MCADFLVEAYGVDLGKIRWLQAGVNEPGRAEKVELKLPAGISYEARPQSSLSAMLASGELDAVISARAPQSFAPDGPVVRLFPNYRAEEERLFRTTGIFPIMHLMVMRRAAFEQHPWIAMNLFKMFDDAKRRCFNRLRDFTCARIPLPWAAAIADEIAAEFGARSVPLRHRGEPADHRGVLPLRPRPGRYPRPHERGGPVPARGDGNGKSIGWVKSLRAISPPPTASTP